PPFLPDRGWRLVDDPSRRCGDEIFFQCSERYFYRMETLCHGNGIPGFSPGRRKYAALFCRMYSHSGGFIPSDRRSSDKEKKRDAASEKHVPSSYGNSRCLCGDSLEGTVS